MQQKWEYCYLESGTVHNGNVYYCSTGQTVKMKNREEALKQLGDAGWEMVGIEVGKEVGIFRCFYFKRPLTS